MIYLYDYSTEGHHIDSSPFIVEIDGLKNAMPSTSQDDLTLWIRSEDGLRGKRTTISEWAQIKTTQTLALKSIPENGWIAKTLPPDILTKDVNSWRTPTQVEIRQVIGDGSLTGINSSKIAEIIGISPQNVRKYLASDTAKHHQNISFSMWHYLLIKLKIQNS